MPLHDYTHLMATEDQYTLITPNDPQPAPAEQPAQAETQAQDAAPTEAQAADVVAPAPAAQEPPAAATEPAAAQGFWEEYGVEEDLARKVLATIGDPEGMAKLARLYSTDVENISNEDAIRMDTRSRYPSYTAEEIEEEVAERMANEFGLGGYDEDSAPNSRQAKKLELLKQTVRDGLLSERAAFTPPAKEAPAAPDAKATQTEQAPLVADPATLLSDPYFKAFEANKTVTFGSGADAFNYTLEDVNLTEYATDPAKTFSLLAKEDGSIDAQTVAQMIAMRKDPTLFSRLMGHAAALQSKREFEGLHNTERDTPQAPKGGSGGEGRYELVRF